MIFLAAGVLAGIPGGAFAGSPGFLRPGDHWVMAGDSITHYDIYRQKAARVYRHFHPGSPVAFLQVGVSGVSSDFKWDPAVSKEATIVSILLGMNDYINSGMLFGKDPAPFLDGYKKEMEKKVAQFREKGAVVLLLSPTKTDPRQDYGIFELRGAEKFHEACAEILKGIAAANDGVYYLPVQEEFDAFDGTLGRKEILRPDGVHPSAPGQYQIARTLWEHLNFAGDPTGGTRATVKEVPPVVPVTVTLAEKLLVAVGQGLELVIAAKNATRVQATWSAGESRGSTALDLVPGENRWRIPVPDAFFRGKPGQLSDVVVDFESGGRRSLYLIDLAVVPVLHPKDGVIEGRIFADPEKPGGKPMGTWAIRREGKGLLLSGEVFDDQISGEQFWPFARDGVSVWLDLRPNERFGGIGVDEDVSQTILNIVDKPFFGCTQVPMLGRGMSLAADSGAERTPSGYKWHLFVHRYFTNKLPVDLANHDFLGFNLVIADEKFSPDGKPATVYGAVHRPQDGAIDKHPDALVLLDWGNKIPSGQAIQASLFGR